MKKKINSINESQSDQYLRQRNSPATISKQMAHTVSHYRRDILEGEVDQGLFKDGNSNITTPLQDRMGPSPAGFVTSNNRGISLQKLAANATSSGTTSGGWRGSGGTMRQSPDIYSPLWLNSNLNLPRDRATINAWSRAFFALNGLVQNAISLHSTYPISKLNIKCSNPHVEKFFADMIEEIDLMNICVQIAQEYWILGEAFVYAELDEANRKWSRLIIQNPDYIVVQRSVIADEPIISLRPDDNLRRICTSNRPTDIAQRQKLDKSIIEHVKRGENIPLNNFYVSHLARKINPYDVRGTGLIVSSFRQLMLFDKLRECHDEETEVLTDQGFKKITDLMEVSRSLSMSPDGVNGAILSDDGKLDGIYALKNDVKIACFNKDNECIEYHKPLDCNISYYAGEMIHFKSRNLDICVTPNHKMWAQKKNRLQGKSGWNDWEKINAKDISPTTTYRFCGNSNWVGKNIKSVNVLNKDINIELYLKFTAYLISEGYIGHNHLDFVQAVNSDCIDDMKSIIHEFANSFDKNLYERICSTEDYIKSGFKKQPQDRWNARINSKAITDYFRSEISCEGGSTAGYKLVPNWIKELNKDLLSIFLNTLVLGDGSHIKNKNSLAWKYYTISKKLADDVQEISFKCGYASSISTKKLKSGNTEYCVSWSDATDGQFPILTPNNKYSDKINKINYNGMVWCFEVPTGLFITRRGGKLTIQGNSKFAQADNMINPLTLVKVGGGAGDYKPSPIDLDAYRQIFEEAQNDKDFKIFTHDAVTVERVGYNQGIVDISPDITQLIKEIYTGLMVPAVLMDGGSDTTYANGSVALDVLRQRYMQFRNMLTIWLRRKIFAPISKINDFYEYVGQGNDRKKVLVVPDIEWNHMSLFDVESYITMLSQLATADDNKRVSFQTLYRSLGLTWEDEITKIRTEDIHAAIRMKEKASLDEMSLNELRALGPSDEIQEASHSPLPGETSEPGKQNGEEQPNELPGVTSPPPPPPETPPPPPSK